MERSRTSGGTERERERESRERDDGGGGDARIYICVLVEMELVSKMLYGIVKMRKEMEMSGPFLGEGTDICRCACPLVLVCGKKSAQRVGAHSLLVSFVLSPDTLCDVYTLLSV